MVDIAPFCGIKYNRGMFDSFDMLVTQPYDKITPEMQDEYYRKSEYNYVRLILARDEDRYSAAAKTFSSWTEKGILVKDIVPAIYPYYQQFQAGKRKLTRRGFVALIRLEDFGTSVLPHEQTLSKPKEDRLNLMRMTRKNFEQVFMLYSDTKDEINRVLAEKCLDETNICAVDEYGVRHMLWTVYDENTIDRVKKLMKDKVVIIADGHHRYETSLIFRNEQLARGGDGRKGWNYRMVTFVNICDKGLKILPSHRLVRGIKDFCLEKFLYDAGKHFRIIPATKREILNLGQIRGKHVFGLYTAKKCYRLLLKNEKILAELLPERSSDYRSLDVTVLQSLILEQLLGIKQVEEYVGYEREASAAIKSVDNKKYQLAFIMNPTRVQQVKKIAENGERMPQKSTDFYPKLISGLVMFDLDDTI